MHTLVHFEVIHMYYVSEAWYFQKAIKNHCLVKFLIHDNNMTLIWWIDAAANISICNSIYCIMFKNSMKYTEGNKKWQGHKLNRKMMLSIKHIVQV